MPVVEDDDLRVRAATGSIDVSSIGRCERIRVLVPSARWGNSPAPLDKSQGLYAPFSVTGEQAWQRLIATTDDDTSSALWASVLIEQGIISSESSIIAYLNTIKIQGQPVKKVRRQFKEHYRLKLWKLINSQSGSVASYQKMKQIADALDSQGKGYFSEGWHQSRYGKRRDPFSSKPINNSTQVVLKTEDAQKYGITLQTEKHRKFDEIYGDEKSATIREHKHISKPLQGDQIKQYQDNVQIVEYNIDSDNHDNSLILEKDGKKYRPDKLVYTFATPEGVVANRRWIRRETRRNKEFLSVEIINIRGEKKTININNLKELDEPALKQWLDPSSANQSKNKS